MFVSDTNDAELVSVFFTFISTARLKFVFLPDDVVHPLPS